jgi:hypothetical protein
MYKNIKIKIMKDEFLKFPSGKERMSALGG